MTISAKSTIQRVTDTLQDPTSIRWPVAELVRYLNDGQREIVLYRPDAMVTDATLALVPGTKQALPGSGTKLLDVPRNANGGRTVRLCDREILDAQVPLWHGLAPSTSIAHYMYDERDPKVFYVYPPAAAGAAVDIVYSADPTDVAEPPAGSDYTAVAGNVSIRDTFDNALQDYILYRAWSKDAEYAGNAARADNHYSKFAVVLGLEIKGTAITRPRPGGGADLSGVAA